MALDETMTVAHDFAKDDDDYGGAVRFMPYGGDEDDGIGYRRISRLSIESSDGNDADAEVSEDEEVVVRKSILASLMEEEGEDSDKDWASMGAASMPGTPLRETPGREVKEYASETEARGRRGGGGGGGGGGGRRRRRARERWLERSWEMKKRMAEEGAAAAVVTEGTDVGECRVLVRPRGGMGTLCMDMEEVKACRDLGLELPRDWTVEIPCALSGSTVDSSSGGNSPIANWRISSPGKNANPPYSLSLSLSLSLSTVSATTSVTTVSVFRCKILMDGDGVRCCCFTTVYGRVGLDLQRLGTKEVEAELQSGDGKMGRELGETNDFLYTIA